MKKIMMIVVMVAAFVLPTTAQEWQSTSAFQSTSTMTGAGSSYSSNPTINENGTANAPSYAPGGPHKAPTPISTEDQRQKNEGGSGKDTPLGDALIPLAVMAMVFAGVIALRRRKAQA